jgi:diaminopimelate decarboxylase
MFKEYFYSKFSRERLFGRVNSLKTPCYIYLLPFIQQRIHEMKFCVGDWFQLHYAVKANPHLEILKLMAQNEIGADVASLGELKAALAQGIPAEKIEFSGPGKSRHELSEAVFARVGSINVESLPELELVAQISRQIQLKANVGIRINPAVPTTQIGLKMAGETQFGVPETQLPEAFKSIRQHPEELVFKGIHVHVGSQILDAAVILNTIQTILELALRLEEKFAAPISKINFGGGWGINYFPPQQPLNLEAIRLSLQSLFQNPRYAAFQSRAQLILEPGRFLVGESGLYVTKVLYRKQTDTRIFLIVDGGLNQNYLIAGGMGQVIRRNFELDILTPSRPKVSEFKFEIAGKLCTPQDILASNCTSNVEIRPDDFVVFFNCGAYGFSASPLFFLSHPLPDEIFI